MQKVAISTPTLMLAHELETAYDWFNQRLFSGKLKRCVILFHRKRSAKGYFWADRWANNDGSEEPEKFHEVALNPDLLRGRPVNETLSTLVHEQVHLWQQDFGKPGKGAGHNREWADKMEEIGLMPSRTGEPGGKRTGKRVTHYIMEGEEFDIACHELLETGFTLSCVSWPAATRVKNHVPKVTVKCPECEIKARVKEEVIVRCGTCKDDDGQYVVMEES